MASLKEKMNLSMILDTFKKNVSLAFLAFLAILFILEIIEIKTSVQLVFSSSGTSQTTVHKTQEVRINFDNYQKAIDRVNNANTFHPSSGTTTNPFQSVK